MLPPNAIIPYDSTHASIPSGWSRDTRFDGLFVKSSSANFGDTGGNATHTHDFAHTHNISAHTHNASSSGVRDNTQWNPGNPNNGLSQAHGHETGSTGNSGGEATQSSTLTTNATSSLPPFYEVIFVKSGGYNFIPTYGLIARTTSRIGMTYHIESENKFFRGAGTGEDAGATGGVSSHLHTQSHTHTVNTHSHAVGYLGGYHSDVEGGGSPGKTSGEWHTHAFNVANSTQAINSNATDSGTTSVEPLNKTLTYYKATTQTLPAVGDIVMIIDGNNPVGWVTCDGTNGTPDLVDYYIKNHSTSQTIAGSNTHTHTMNHAHTGNGTHTHTPDSISEYNGESDGHNGSGRTSPNRHRHNMNAIQAVTANYDTTTGSTDATNNEPPYILVRFIQATQSALFFGAPVIALV